MSFWIALRYFFSRRNLTLVNIISIITLISILFITTSMFLVLAIFNGFGLFHQNIYQNSTPDLKIEHINKSSFNIDSNLVSILDSYYIDSIIDFSKVLEREIVIQISEENKYSQFDKQAYAIIKGVDENYKNIYNDFELNKGKQPKAIAIQSDLYGYRFDSFLHNSDLIIAGKNLASRIDLKVYNYNQNQDLRIWYLKSNQNRPSLNYEDNLKLSAIFNFGESSIDNIIIAEINKIQNMFDFFEYSYIEVKVNKDLNIIQEKIQNDLGSNFIVKNREQQSPLIFKIIKTEKLVVYLIFILITIITMITLIGSIFILINQKKKDVVIFSSLGYSRKIIRSIFSYLGFLIVFFGFIFGMISGIIFCLIQQATGIITLETPLGIVPYPVDFQIFDIIIVAIIILGIGFIISNIVSRLIFLRKII